MSAAYRLKLDHFAELLSMDLAISDIRERMGISKRRAYGMLARIRSDLGPQAQ